jgi:hypothetical protein
MFKSKFTIIAMVLLSGLLLAQTPGEYVTSRTLSPPVIDGIIDDTCWETVAMAGDFKMHMPYDDRPATFQTKFAILYDDNNLYVAIRAFDPEPDKIYKQITRRDEVNSEFVAVCIDSYNDNNTSFCFFVTPSGVIGDLFLSKDGEINDESWNAIWWGKSHIDEQGWTAEFRIPLSQLRFTDKHEQIWGLDIMRDIHRLDEESFWMLHKRNNQGFVHQFGTLRGLFDIKARKVADIYPYAVGSLNTYEAEAGNPYMDGSDMKINGGIDGKIGLTNNFTMDFTVNPDFGQVEADPATVNLSAFETFFSERRPFFIEGNNITSFELDVNGSSEQLFHSRRIGRRPHYWPDLEDDEYSKQPSSTDIIAAAKITGRTEKGMSIGVVEAVTQKEFAHISDSTMANEQKVAVEPLTNYTVAAIRQDLNNGSTQLGGIVTAVNRKLDDENLNYLHKQAYTGGIDFRQYFKDHIWQIDAKVFGSYVQGSEEAISETQQSSSHLYQRPDADWVTYDSTRTSLAGHGGSVRIGKFGGQFRAALKVNWKSPGLELNDVGFVGRTDEIQQNLWFQYRKTDPFAIFNQLHFSAYQWNSFNFGGLHQNSGLNLSLNTQFKNRMGFDLGLEYNSDYLSSTALRGGPRLLMPSATYAWIWFGTDYTKDVEYWAFTLNGWNKDKLNYYHRLENEIEWKVSPFLNFSLYADWDSEQNVFHYVTDVDYDGDSHYILSKFNSQSASMQISVNWNISPNISLEYRGRPFFMSGKYSEFKVITDGDNANYEDRFDLFTDNITLTDEVYYCDEDRDMITDYSFDDPDFVYNSYQSNLVFRWEYQPGSTLFLVWSRNHELGTGEDHLDIPLNIRELNDEIPQNVFLVKVSYRLGR